MSKIEYPKMKRDEKKSAKLSEQQAEDVVRIYKSGDFTINEISHQFGVCWRTIKHIVDPKERLRNSRYLNKFYSDRISPDKKKASMKEAYHRKWKDPEFKKYHNEINKDAAYRNTEKYRKYHREWYHKNKERLKQRDG